MSYTGETMELGAASTPAEPTRRSLRSAVVPAALAMALFGALFATSMRTREADPSEKIAGAMQRLSTQRAATYDDCETMRHGAHGCISKTKLLHNGTSIDCHEVSNFALDYFCGDNHTNTAALAHMVNTQYDAGNTCGLVETFLTTCMTSSDIFCKVYSIQAEEASKTYMGCDSDSTTTSRKTPWFSNANASVSSDGPKP